MSNHASTYHRLAKSNVFDLIEGGQANLPTIAEIRRMVRKARAHSARAQITKAQTSKVQTTKVNTANPQITRSGSYRVHTAQRLATQPQPGGQRQAAQTQPKKAAALGPLTNITRGANWRRDRNGDPWAQDREIDTGNENAPPLDD